jgi:ubiquinone biosynthesis protein UbiJ
MPRMADWNDPTTWKDVSKHGATLKELSKSLTQATRDGEAHLALATGENVVSVLQGHQQTLADVSFVAGKLVAYITAAHEERIREVEAIHDLSKSIRQLTKTVAQLTKRVEKLEKRAVKVSR